MSRPPNAVVVEVKGRPLTDELYTLFAPWGMVKGIATIRDEGIAVDFEEGYQMVFVPMFTGGTVGGD